MRSSSSNQYIVEVSRSSAEKFFWLLKRRSDGKTIAASAQPYESEEAAIDSVRVVALVLNDGLYDVVRTGG